MSCQFFVKEKNLLRHSNLQRRSARHRTGDMAWTSHQWLELIRWRTRQVDCHGYLIMVFHEMIWNDTEYLSRFSKFCHKKLELTSQPTAPQRRHRTPWGIRNHSFFSNPSCKRILSRMILHVKKVISRLLKKILEKNRLYYTHNSGVASQ